MRMLAQLDYITGAANSEGPTAKLSVGVIIFELTQAI